MNRSCLLLFLVLVMGAMVCTGFRLHRSQNCLCSNVYRVHPQNVRSYQVFPRGPYCDNVEIVVTLKNQKKVCLNPATRMGKIMLQRQ